MTMLNKKQKKPECEAAAIISSVDELIGKVTDHT